MFAVIIWLASLGALTQEPITATHHDRDVAGIVCLGSAAALAAQWRPDTDAQAVPEPASVAIYGLGFAAYLTRRKR